MTIKSDPSKTGKWWRKIIGSILGIYYLTCGVFKPNCLLGWSSLSLENSYSQQQRKYWQITMESKPKSSLSYVLFLYREQLRRGNIQSTRLNRTKITLTDKLIRKTADNIRKCSINDMITLNRQIAFKQKLKYQVASQRNQWRNKVGETPKETHQMPWEDCWMKFW